MVIDFKEANAHLIAAAPAMYEALQACAEHWQDTDSPLGARVRAALRQAEGRAASTT